MSTALTSGRQRLATFVLALSLAVVVGGADGCSGDPNIEGARLSIRNGDLTEASAQLGRALEANPDNVSALVLRADVNRRRADASSDAGERQTLLDQMATDIARAYQLAPDNDEVRVIRINGWATSITKGNQALTNQSVDPSVSRGLFQTAVNVLPDSSQGHFGLGLAHLRADDPAAAVPHLRRSIEIEPGNVTAHIYLGRSLLLSEQASEGITALEAAAVRFPDNQDVQASLLNAYAVGGRTDEALAQYERAVASTPDDALIRYNYGALLLRAERYDDAIAQLERATALAPSNGDAHYNLGAAIQNKASALNEQANDTANDAEAEALIAQRDELLNRSLTHLLRAREISAAASDADEERVACLALFRVYLQLNRTSDAQAVAACAGENMN